MKLSKKVYFDKITEFNISAGKQSRSQSHKKGCRSPYRGITKGNVSLNKKNDEKEEN